jgi:hypothetical protein
MKKALSTFISIVLLFSIGANFILAKEKDDSEEKKLNKILIKSGMPEEILNDLDFETKKFFIENSGERFNISRDKKTRAS